MKTFASTPTTTRETWSQTGSFPNCAALFLKRFHSLFGTFARGFYFDNFAPAGAYSKQEVTIE